MLWVINTIHPHGNETKQGTVLISALLTGYVIITVVAAHNDKASRRTAAVGSKNRKTGGLSQHSHKPGWKVLSLIEGSSL